MATKKSNSKETTSNSRRWWVQLQFSFFTNKRMSTLHLKYGSDALIIYQKMMLKSLENGNSMKYEGLGDTFEEEVAIDIMERESVQLIAKVIEFLIKQGLMIEQEDGSFFFPQASEMSGSEGSSAARMREKRERDKEASHCDSNMSQCDADALQCDGDIPLKNNMSHCDDIRTITETETEPDLHLKSDEKKTLDVRSKTEQEQVCADADSVDRLSVSAAADAEPPTGDLFSVAKLNDIVAKNKIKLSDEGVKIFHEEMQESGWTLYGRPVEKKFISRALNEWTKKHVEFHKDSGEGSSGVQKGKKTTPEPVPDIESEIWEIAKEYISQRRFDENPGGHKLLIYRYCPKNAFDQDQLDHMAGWGVYPKHQDYVEVDEYLEDE